MTTSLEINLKVPGKEKAKYWFRRKPYTGFDLRRGDAGGQANIESVSSAATGDTEIKEGYIEAGGTVEQGSDCSRQSNKVE